jgi:peptide/nickel transport system permease protein
MCRHILPNVVPTFVVLSTLSVATLIVTESSLSFLGLGIQPPDISWGLMLTGGRDYLATAWWLSTFPGVCITVTVLAFLFIGDWLRDRLDPRLKSHSEA